MSILSSQADPPTLKNVDFASAGARFSKNQGLGINDGIENVLGVSWAPFGGLLGGSWGLFWSSWGIQMAPLNSKTSFFALLMLYIAPRGAPNSPPGALRAKQMASRSHQDASGDVLRPTSLKFGWQNATADGGENVGKLLAHHTGSWALWRCRRAAH